MSQRPTQAELDDDDKLREQLDHARDMSARTGKEEWKLRLEELNHQYYVVNDRIRLYWKMR